MTVADLIEFLQKQPQNLQVAYRYYSEQVLLEADDIQIAEKCEPREDGWMDTRQEARQADTDIPIAARKLMQRIVIRKLPRR